MSQKGDDEGPEGDGEGHVGGEGERGPSNTSSDAGRWALEAVRGKGREMKEEGRRSNRTEQ